MTNGKPSAVILKIKDYEALLERAANAEDLKWRRERRKRPAHFRSFEEFLAERSAVYEVQIELEGAVTILRREGARAPTGGLSSSRSSV